MNNDRPLKRGDKVQLLPPDWNNNGRDTEVEKSGRAGFFVRNHVRMLWWNDRGKTWDSVKLDRIDDIRTRFSGPGDMRKERANGNL
jgi:hypothetical protein